MAQSLPYDSVLVRFGELGLKDNNRGFFERRLKRNIKQQLGPVETEGVERLQGALRIGLRPESPLDRIVERLKSVAGIAWFAACREVEREPEGIARLVLDRAGEELRDASTFAVSTQRSDKSLDRNSQDFNVAIGSVIDEETDLSVDLDNPDREVHVHLLFDRAYVFLDRHRHEGFRGLPVEASGDALCLLSGGIDSPVAAVKAFKRGTRLDFLHYYPYPSARAALDKKMGDLVEHLTRFGTRGRLYMAPYHLYDLHAPTVTERDEVLLFRRHIVRVAQALADEHGHKALVTGESLGQVASQTLENIGTIADVSEVPILRPLIGLDKQEIVDAAKRHGTFEQSVREYQDCCTIQSTNVRTRSSAERFRDLEARENVEDVDRRILEAIDVFEYGPESLRPRRDESARPDDAERSTESNSSPDATPH